MQARRRTWVPRVAAIAGAVAALAGCGDDRMASCTEFGGTAAISGNHGHSLSIPAADFTAGADRTYSIQGTADHDHEVTLTAAQLQTVAGGTNVTVESSGSSTPPVHVHEVTVTCVVGGGGGGY